MSEAAAVLRAMEEELSEARASREALLQVLVHDLRSPLGSVILFLDLLHTSLGGAGLEKDAELAALARGEALRLGELLGDALLLSTLPGRPVAPLAPMEMRPLLEEVASANEARAAAAGVPLLLASPGAPRASFDARLLRRALEAMVSSALRTVKAGDRIELRAEGSGQAPAFLVSHSGAPPSAPVLAALGAPPEGEAAAARDRELRAGLKAGLGLHLARMIAQAHGGALRLSKRQGWSVTFELLLQR
jgi:signal transduction histidine kinase